MTEHLTWASPRPPPNSRQGEVWPCSPHCWWRIWGSEKLQTWTKSHSPERQDEDSPCSCPFRAPGFQFYSAPLDSRWNWGSCVGFNGALSLCAHEWWGCMPGWFWAARRVPRQWVCPTAHPLGVPRHRAILSWAWHCEMKTVCVLSSQCCPCSSSWSPAKTYSIGLQSLPCLVILSVLNLNPAVPSAIVS